MNLFESIDRLLFESVQAIGFGSEVEDTFESKNLDSKSVRFLATHFKEQPFDVDDETYKTISHDIATAPPNEHRKEFANEILKKLGIRNEFKTSDRKKIVRLLTSLFKERSNTIDDVRKFGKKVTKAAKNVNSRHDGISTGTLDDLHEYIEDSFDHLLAYSAGQFLSRDKVSMLVNFLQLDSNNYRKIKNKDLEGAIKVAEVDGLDPNRVYMEFVDGYYWYKLKTRKECDIEAEKLGHCGEPRIPGSKMYSLRDENNEPIMTIARKNKEVNEARTVNDNPPGPGLAKYVKAFMDKANAKFTDTFSDVTSHSLPQSAIDKFLEKLEE